MKKYILMVIFSQVIAGSAYAEGPDQCAAAFQVVSKAYSSQGNAKMAEAAQRFSFESYKILSRMLGEDNAAKQVKGFLGIYQRQISTGGIDSMQGTMQNCVAFLQKNGVK